MASVSPEPGQSRVGILIDSLPEPALIADCDGNILAANQALAALFEADDPARIVGKTVFDLISQEQVASSAAGAVPKFGPPVHLVVAGTTLKGNPRTFEIFNVPLIGESGGIEQILGFVLDVTKQGIAERERTLLAAIVESSGDAIVSISLDGKITSWNQGAKNLFGFGAAEAIGQPVTIYIPAEQHERTALVLSELKANPGRVVSFEAPNLRKDGSVIETSMTICGIYDRTGKLAGISAIHRDVTERKRGERDRNLLAAIVESSDDAIIGTAPDFQIVTWNRAAQKLTGFTADEVIGQPCDIIVPLEDRDRAHAIFASVAEQPGHVMRFEAPIQRKDGSRVEVSAVAFEIRGAGGEIGQSVIMHDISERRRMERERALLAAIVESSEDAIISIDPQLRITTWNKGAEKLFGFTAEEAIGQPFTLFVPRARHSKAEDSARRSQASLSTVVGVEVHCQRKDGRPIDVSITTSVIRGPAGEVVGQSAILRDITARKRAEREQAMLAAIVESSDDAIIRISPEWVIMAWNRGAQNLLGFTVEEAVGQSADICVPQDMRTQARAGVADDLALMRQRRGVARRLEVPMQRKDGSQVEVSLVVSGIYSSEGEPLGMSWVVRDISERKRAERALVAAQGELRSRLRQQAVVARLGQRALGKIEPAMLMDEAAALTAETLDVERCAILELQPDEKSLLLRAGAGWKEGMVGSASVDASKQSLAGYALASRAPVVVSDFNAETRFGCGALLGAEDAASALAVVISYDHERYGVLGVQSRAAREFTRDDVNFVQAVAHIVAETLARRRFERELSAARDAALESARAKSAFLAAMSHEIRTPLNSIVGLIGLLLETRLTAEQRDFMQNILASSDALLSTINNVLDFSRLSAGRVALEEVEFEPRTVTEGAADMVAEAAQRKGLELAVSIDEQVPRMLRGDPARVRQVLINLLSNAVKFTERGEVVLRVSLESEADSSARLRFSVTDTGIGISEEAQRLLFQPFSQADTSTTRKYGGSGLGLAISAQLAEQMGGKIGVNSCPGQGSTFWFTAAFVKTAATQGPASVERELEGLHVLIVDDNATNRWILRHQVESWGMRADAVASGAEALDLVRRRADNDPYTIVLLDYFMPEMDGFELANRIKADPANAKVHLVMMSSAGRPREFGARAAPIEAWLTKPIKSAQLFKCLTSLPTHDGEQLRPPAALAAALAARPPVQPAAAAAMVEAPAVAERAHGRILLVEDNPINQKVALTQLKRLGYEADDAANGREALEAMEKTSYDAVLMDCQMPEMDGYEATRALRKREAGARHTVVIAMTAHGLAGDREKCLAAGMDDYLAKPVRKEQLDKILRRWLSARPPASARAPAVSAAVASPDGGALFDVAILGALRGEGSEFFSELTEMFDAEVPALLSRLAEAFAKRDAKGAAAVAYRLKGTAAIFGARRMQEQAAAIDQTVRTGSMELAATMLEGLRAEFERVRAVLNAECAKQVAAPSA